MSGSDTPEYRLLHPLDGKEDTRKANIREWLHSIGVSGIRTEYETGAGPADIYLTNRRVMIETKGRGRADPDDDTAGSRPGETPMQQLTRYLNAERRNEQRTLDEGDNRDLPWIGIITDSETWHVYEWTATGPAYVADWRGRRLDSTNIVWLAERFQKRVGKDWVPEDPTSLLEGHLRRLNELYELKHDERDVETQRALWYMQLKISGNQPDEQHEDELFVLHTLLIALATRISEKYGNEDYRYGFASWVRNTDWLEDLNRTIEQYNWKPQTGDVLRTLYMGLVPKEHRHIYGEYYTPDWLAEKLCREVIDDQYIESYIAGTETGGVMDPACGSGTFLYHAVHRIATSKPVQDATLDNRELTDMIMRMIHGIDIHPVAVAMAKANVLRAMPDRPSEPLRIYQGDSLQINRNVKDDPQQKMDELESRILEVPSRRGKRIRLPLEFIEFPDFDRMMYRFAKAAAAGNPFPPKLDDKLGAGRGKILRRAFDTLTRVCRDEGNDVWAWYVINRAGIYLLNGQIARIVANPPWVRVSNIQDKARNDEVVGMAKTLELWVGGRNATGFNIASLFVIQCRKLYGTKAIRSGWVLPDAAMRGGNWQKYIKMTNATALLGSEAPSNKQTEKHQDDQQRPPTVWDLGDLPFPGHSKACVNIFGVSEQPPQRLTLNDGADPLVQIEGWDAVEERTTFIQITQPTAWKSSWFSGKRPIARQGAILTPSCLVILDNYKEKDGNVCGTTVVSRHGAWRGKSFSVEVPKSWVHRAWFNKGGLLPYMLGNPRGVILPIDENGRFIPDRNEIKWWRDASDKYGTHRGSGKTTPKTLEAQLDFNDKLSNQFPIEKNVVLYCTSGANMCAARMTSRHIVDSSLYRVKTNSKNEALFLVGILNADVMRDWFRQTRKSDRHFHTYFWSEIPIPRFNRKNTDHQRLARLAKHAEGVAGAVIDPSRDRIRKALRDDGVAGRIDETVTKIIDAIKESLV